MQYFESYVFWSIYNANAMRSLFDQCKCNSPTQSCRPLLQCRLGDEPRLVESDIQKWVKKEAAEAAKDYNQAEYDAVKSLMSQEAYDRSLEAVWSPSVGPLVDQVLSEEHPIVLVSEGESFEQLFSGDEAISEDLTDDDDYQDIIDVE